MTPVQKKIAEYEARIENLGVSIDAMSEAIRTLRNTGKDYSEELAERRRMSDLRQLCFQVIVDLKELA